MDLTDFVVEPSPAFPTSDICSAAACQVATEQHHWPPWQFAPLQLTMRNVNDAWHHAKKIIRKTYLVRPSRNGEVREYPAPVTTCYLRPEERVLFDPRRNANPFFHFFESLWMLAGRNDVKWITQFLPRFGEYSDDGETFHGAYGYRWRHWFDLDGGAEEDFPDQLKKVIRLLKDGPHDRRIVLGMWDPRADLDNSRCKDLPCNTHVYFYVRDNVLTMTVCCRSNDIAWGCYGANAVHFSVLHEYVARMTGYGVGPYYQMSNSWHLYMNVWEQFVGDTDAYPLQDPYYDSEYAEEVVKPYPLVHHPESFDTELRRFVSAVADVPIYGMPVLSPSVPNYNPFFLEVARPILRAFLLYKENKIPAAIKILEENCGATDWRLTCQLWLTRIQNKRLRKQGSSSVPTDNES